MMNLDQILSDEALDQEAAPVEAEQPEAEVPQSNEQTDEAASARLAFDAEATIAERRKRQDAERERDEYRQRLEALEAAKRDAETAASQAAEYDDEDPVAFAVRQASLSAREVTSEVIARSKHEDFDEVKAHFMTLAQQNPALAQKALNSPSPWEEAYKMAKSHKEMEQLGATDIASLRAEIEAKVRAEFEAKSKAQQFPDSLASGQAQGGRVASPPPFKSLDEILRG